MNVGSHLMEKNLNAEIAEKELTQTGKNLCTGIKIMAYALNVGRITLWEMKGFALNVLQRDILKGLLDTILTPKSSRQEIGLNRRKSEQDEPKRECVLNVVKLRQMMGIKLVQNAALKQGMRNAISKKIVRLNNNENGSPMADVGYVANLFLITLSYVKYITINPLNMSEKV